MTPHQPQLPMKDPVDTNPTTYAIAMTPDHLRLLTLLVRARAHREQSDSTFTILNALKHATPITVKAPVTRAKPTQAELDALDRLQRFPTAKVTVAVLDAIKRQHPQPVTKKEVATIMGTTRDQAHPRMRQLNLGGWIEPTGKTRRGTAADGNLWRLTKKALGHGGEQ